VLTHDFAIQAQDPPSSAAERIRELNKQIEQIRADFEIEFNAKRNVAIQKLQTIQDHHARETKLDEAVAVRDLIRGLKTVGLDSLDKLLARVNPSASNPKGPVTGAVFLTPQSVEIVRALEQDAGPLREKMEGEIAVVRGNAIQKLTKIQADCTRQGQLDAAIEIRDFIFRLTNAGAPSISNPNGSVTNVRSPQDKISRKDALPPPQAAEVMTKLDEETKQLQGQLENDAAAQCEIAIRKLQEIQDFHTKEAKLDEAVAIRDSIRFLKNRRPPKQPIREMPGQQNGPTDQVPASTNAELPFQASETIKALMRQLEQYHSKVETKIAARRALAIRKLQELQDSYSRETKLNEAVATREQIRNLKSAGLKRLPDPGSLVNYRGQIGKVLIFEVTGSMNGSIYGTDIYTDDSSLSAAAVHANALKVGETGLVKVTILAGQDSYASTIRNGVRSSTWNQYPGSFKVQALFRGSRPPLGTEPERGRPAPIPEVPRLGEQLPGGLVPPAAPGLQGGAANAAGALVPVFRRNDEK